jgi:hypothetical protein
LFALLHVHVWATPLEATAMLQIAIDKKRRMKGQQHAHQKPELIKAHEQLQKKDAKTNAAKHPTSPIIMSVKVTLVICA